MALPVKLEEADMSHGQSLSLPQNKLCDVVPLDARVLKMEDSSASGSTHVSIEFEHTADTRGSGFKNTSYLSQCTTAACDTPVVDPKVFNGVKPDVEQLELTTERQGRHACRLETQRVVILSCALPAAFPRNAVEVEPCGEPISIWTFQTCGIVFGGFLLAFLNHTCSGVAYGFFLGYMGLDAYIIASIAAPGQRIGFA